MVRKTATNRYGRVHIEAHRFLPPHELLDLNFVLFEMGGDGAQVAIEKEIAELYAMCCELEEWPELKPGIHLHA